MNRTKKVAGASTKTAKPSTKNRPGQSAVKRVTSKPASSSSVRVQKSTSMQSSSTQFMSSSCNINMNKNSTTVMQHNVVTMVNQVHITTTTNVNARQTTAATKRPNKNIQGGGPLKKAKTNTGNAKNQKKSTMAMGKAKAKK